MSEPLAAATALRREPPQTPADKRPSRRERWAALRPFVPLVAVAITAAILSWPVATLSPQPGLDGSWAIGLHLAASEGMDFGTDVLFTYGPLGYLKHPLLVDPLTVRIAFAYTAVIQLLLCLTALLMILRATGSLLVAGLGALVVGGIVVQEPAVILAFAWAVALAARLVEDRWATWLVGSLGVLTGVELLAKLNTGVTILALGILAVAVSPARRRLGLIYGSATAVVFAGLWALSGQSIAAFDNWLTGSYEIVSGYSESMTLSMAGGAWQYWAALVLVGIGFAAVWQGSAGNRRLRIGLLLLWATLAFTSFKEGFVRHDAGHADIFFASMVGGLVALAWVPHRRMTGVLIALLALTALFGATGQPPSRVFDPFDRVDALVQQTKMLADGSATNEGIDGGIGSLLTSYGIDPRTYAQLEGHTVHADPWEVGAVFAERLDWDPVPIFQSYSAYTAELDRRNARAFAATDAPERVLREPGDRSMAATGSGRPRWPRARCSAISAKAQTSPRWQVLVRTATVAAPLASSRPCRRATAQPSRCLPPPAGELLYAEVDGVAVGGLERLRAAAWKPEVRRAVINGDRVFRLIPDTAINGLLLAVPREADYSGPFAMDQGADTLTFTKGDDGSGEGDLTVRFVAQTID